MGKTWFRSILAAMLVGVVGLFLAAGCTPTTTGGGGTTGPTPIKIGAIISITGPNAPLGAGQKAALEMLVAETNKANGINGSPIELVIEDDASDPKKAAAAASKLIEQDKVVAILGGTGTATTMSSIPESVKAKIPQISLAAGVPITDPLKVTVFRTAPSDKVAVQKVIDYLSKIAKIKTFAILHDSNAFGASGADQLTTMAPTAGLKITANEAYDTNATDLTPQLTKIKGTNPDVVVVWGTNPGPAIAAKQMRELGMKQPFVGSHGISNMKFIELAGPAANGVVFPAPPILIPSSIPTGSPQRKVVDDFIAAFTAKTGAPPNSFAGHAYDGYMILVDALKKAGADPQKLAEAIAQTQGLVGVGGTFTYSATDHDALTADNLILVKIQNGKWTLLKTSQP